MVFSKSHAALAALCVLASSQEVFGRMRWLERDDKPVFLHPRRFGQEHPAVIDKLSSACDGAVCGNLAGAAITPLLAAQGECTQQDMADQIIDAAQQFDAATKANMIALAVEYRQVEKNTPPDFSVQPNINRNSVFCQKAPKNSELNGLVQAQDPANDPNVFFDPATKASVKKGSQANTFPFGSSGASSSDNSSDNSSGAAATSTEDLVAASATTDCSDTLTVTVTAGSAAAATSAASSSSSASSASDIGNFGSCSVPQIEFGVGFDNRKETSFQPVDKTSYDHGSAQAIGIISQFICDQLTNKCGADATAKATCASAITAANGGTAKTGVQADLFNGVFGIKTNFANVAVVDDQGRTVSGGGATAAAGNNAASATAAAPAAPTGGSTSSSSSGIGSFGSCSVPQIEFGVGFDNRKETSFQPVDKTSYDHGSAQAIGIISQFICDQLTNKCGADATAKATCAKAITAANGGAAKTGVQADLFNAVFGIKTDFAAVQAIDDQGRPVAGTGSATAQAAVVTGNNAASASASSSGIGSFGSCSVPQIKFGVGFDNRKETSFEPADQASYDHGSAQAIGIISQFICDTLTNKCGADATAKATCAKAITAANGGAAKTGVQADLFNAVFGIKTNFANTPVVSDTGVTISGGSATAAAPAQAGSPKTAAAPAKTAAAAASGGNLQKFTGALGGVTPPPVTANGDGSFQVSGNASFNDLNNALTRSCDVQHNKCADAANASGNKGGLTVEACGTQQTQCDAAH